MHRKTVFITGTTGSMGGAGLEILLERRQRFDIVTLVRPSQKNKALMHRYEGIEGLRVVWGDLTNYDDVLECVTGADVVLHPAAMIAPEADHNPVLARTINVGSTENIVRAIRAQREPDRIRLVYIGSVAMTGDRLYPIHVGRTGDPLKPSIYDAYACSKIDAERVVAESGLKYWASLRQTFVAIPDTLALMDPIMFHQPLETCIELCTAHDAGLLLANACEDDVPEEFWRRFYNIGGGASARLTYFELMQRIFGALGLGEPHELAQRNWFALRNFHCQWFEDSGTLNDYLHFQTMGVNEYVASVLEGSPWYVRLPSKPVIRDVMRLPLVKALIRRFLMQRLASSSRDATMFWVQHGLADRISAFFKDRDAWEAIPSHWNGIRHPNYRDYRRLDHGYDEALPDSALGLAHMQGAARFRGGKCSASSVQPGDLFTPLEWECWRGHRFAMTPNSVLKGGHWCPQCEPARMGWAYDEEAAHNPFFAQVWYPNHDATEANYYSTDCYLDVANVS